MQNSGHMFKGFHFIEKKLPHLAPLYYPKFLILFIDEIGVIVDNKASRCRAVSDLDQTSRWRFSHLNMVKIKCSNVHVCRIFTLASAFSVSIAVCGVAPSTVSTSMCCTPISSVATTRSTTVAVNHSINHRCDQPLDQPLFGGNHSINHSILYRRIQRISYYKCGYKKNKLIKLFNYKHF